MGNRIALLAFGDLCAFVFFGAIGLTSHEDAVTVRTVVRAILLFPASWFAIGGMLTAFSEKAVAGTEPLWRIAAMWLVAGVFALCVRALVFDRALLNAFFVIALVGNGVLLIAWRAVYSALVGRGAAATG